MIRVPFGSAWRVPIPLADPPARVSSMAVWWRGFCGASFVKAGEWDGAAWMADAGLSGDTAASFAALAVESGRLLLAADHVARLAGGWASVQWRDQDGVELTLPDRDALDWSHERSGGRGGPWGPLLGVDTLFGFDTAHRPRQSARAGRLEAAIRGEQALEAILMAELAATASAGGMRRLRRPDEQLPGDREAESKAESGVERALVACRERIARLEAAAGGSPFIGWTLR